MSSLQKDHLSSDQEIDLKGLLTDEIRWNIKQVKCIWNISNLWVNTKDK